MTRKLTMLATMVVMPGGLVALLAIACLFVLVRTHGGRRALATLKKRIPPRVKAPLRKLLLLAHGEEFFLSGPSQLQSS